MTRISALRLSEIDLALTGRDREILEKLSELRYLKTNQIQRLFFPPLVTPRAALSATTRALNRLKNLGIISHLERRIGGVRAGSQGLIWHLTEAGLRLLAIGTLQAGKRIRFQEPSPTFLRHILAVAECYTQITQICQTEKAMGLSEVTVEPECWRKFTQNGKVVSLRPDLFAKTTSGDYQDTWFIEMDLATESATDIVTKCRRYHQYYQTGIEQRDGDVFPIVLWVVPDQARKERLEEAITTAFRGRVVHIFKVITPNALRTTLRDGVPMEQLI